LLKRGQRVIDLGCAPGSWSTYAIERIGDGGALVGVDLTEVRMPGGTFLVRSVFEVTADELLAALGGPADLPLSDMAPLTTGARAPACGRSGWCHPPRRPGSAPRGTAGRRCRGAPRARLRRGAGGKAPRSRRRRRACR